MIVCHHVPMTSLAPFRKAAWRRMDRSPTRCFVREALETKLALRKTTRERSPRCGRRCWWSSVASRAADGRRARARSGKDRSANTQRWLVARTRRPRTCSASAIRCPRPPRAEQARGKGDVCPERERVALIWFRRLDSNERWSAAPTKRKKVRT